MTVLKTAKGRKISSTKWLERQIKDPFVNRAVKDGYRSRAAYKLIEINDRYGFLSSGNVVVDLGSSPGGWSQVVESVVGRQGRVIAIDTLPMAAIPNVLFINKRVEECCLNDFLKDKVDVVISDMAPDSSGDKKLDHLRSMNLCSTCVDFALSNLVLSGTLLMKVLQGGGERELYNSLKKFFSVVKYCKPKASRRDSSEIYILSKCFLGVDSNLNEH